MHVDPEHSRHALVAVFYYVPPVWDSMLNTIFQNILIPVSWEDYIRSYYFTFCSEMWRFCCLFLTIFLLSILFESWECSWWKCVTINFAASSTSQDRFNLKVKWNVHTYVALVSSLFLICWKNILILQAWRTMVKMPNLMLSIIGVSNVFVVIKHVLPIVW